MQIGTLKLRNNVLLAPMAGLTDAPFRQAAWRCGVGYSVGEMVSARADLWHSPKSRLRRVRAADSGPQAVQLAGYCPQTLAEAAARHVSEGAAVIDLNFGCPAKKVCRKAAGSALMSDPALIETIVGAVVARVDVPVTVKMRTGPAPESRNGVEIAQRIEAAGAAMLVVHARTRACRFVGEVDYGYVGEISQAVSIPVVINGDIASMVRAREALAISGAAGVMVGRAAIGQPWLLGQLAGQSLPSQAERWEIACEHIATAHAFYGEDMGVRIVRKHLAGYLSHFGYAHRVRDANRIDVAADQLQFLSSLAGQESKHYEQTHQTRVA